MGVFNPYGLFIVAYTCTQVLVKPLNSIFSTFSASACFVLSCKCTNSSTVVKPLKLVLVLKEKQKLAKRVNAKRSLSKDSIEKC